MKQHFRYFGRKSANRKNLLLLLVRLAVPTRLHLTEIPPTQPRVPGCRSSNLLMPNLKKGFQETFCKTRIFLTFDRIIFSPFIENLSVFKYPHRWILYAWCSLLSFEESALRQWRRYFSVDFFKWRTLQENQLEPTSPIHISRSRRPTWLMTSEGGSNQRRVSVTSSYVTWHVRDILLTSSDTVRESTDGRVCRRYACKLTTDAAAAAAAAVVHTVLLSSTRLRRVVEKCQQPRSITSTFHQILTNFQNYFFVTLSSKFSMKS